MDEQDGKLTMCHNMSWHIHNATDHWGVIMDTTHAYLNTLNMSYITTVCQTTRILKLLLSKP